MCRMDCWCSSTGDAVSASGERLSLVSCRVSNICWAVTVGLSSHSLVGGNRAMTCDLTTIPPPRYHEPSHPCCQPRLPGDSPLHQNSTAHRLLASIPWSRFHPPHSRRG